MKTLFFLLLSVGLCAPALGLPLVLNGGFETGDFTDWTQSGDPSFTYVDAPGHAGNFSAIFGPVDALGFIAQDLATSVGGNYSLDFYLRNDDVDLDNRFVVLWDGLMLDDFVNLPTFDWNHFTYTGLTASTSSTKLSFGFYNMLDYFYLDDVNVGLATTPVPEPASILLLGGGLALGGVFLRRRSRTRS